METFVWMLFLVNETLPIEHGGNIINITSRFICKKNSIVKHIFNNSISKNNVVEYSNRAIVSPLNDNCNLINQRVLCLLSRDLKKSCSRDSVTTSDSAEKLNIQLLYLNSIRSSRMLPQKTHPQIWRYFNAHQKYEFGFSLGLALINSAARWYVV